MAISITCPHCEATFKVSDSLRGKKVRCKKCEEAFVARPPRKKDDEDEREHRIQGKPQPARRGPRRPADENDDDDRPSPKLRKKKGGGAAGNVLLILGGVCAFAMLVCCGVGGYGFYTFYYGVKTTIDDMADLSRDMKGPNLNPPVLDPGIGSTRGIASVADALKELREGDAGRKRSAATWLARSPLAPGQQAEVAQALQAMVKDPDGSLRGPAMDALKVWATPDTVPTIIEVLANRPQGPPSQEQRAALEILGKLQDERGAEPVARCLENFFTRGEAVKALQSIGTKAEKAVLKYAYHPDNGVRDSARNLLRGWNTQPGAILAQGIEELKSPDTSRRKAVLEVLNQSPVEDGQRAAVATAIEGLIGDMDRDLVDRAGQALVLWATREHVPGLARFLDVTGEGGRGNFFLRRRIIGQLGQFKDERAVPALAKCLTRTQEMRDAGQALQAIGGPAVEKELTANYAMHADRRVRDEANRILKALGSQVGMNPTPVPMPGGPLDVTRALAGLKGADPKARQEAAQWFAANPPDEARRNEASKTLEGCVEDADAAVRDNAIKAIGTWGNKESGTALVKALNHASPATRQAVLESLGKIKDERVLLAVVQRLALPQDRNAASAALKAYGPVAETVVAGVLQASPDRTVKVEACRILQEIGTKRSAPFLQLMSKQAMVLKYKDLADAASAAAAAAANR